MRAVGNLKICPKCGRSLSVNEFFRANKRPDGLRVYCKDCERDYDIQRADQRSAYQKQYREENKERLAEQRVSWVEENREELLEKKRAYNRLPEVIGRMIGYRRRHYEEHKEEYLEKSARWKAENPEKVQQSQQAWKERNSEKVTESRARYNRDNPETVIAWSQRRRAKQAQAAVGDVDFKRIWKRDRGVCYLCGRSVDKKDVHYDHVIPLSRGGAHSEENLRVTHGRCNLIKGAKLVEELDMSRFK